MVLIEHRIGRLRRTVSALVALCLFVFGFLAVMVMSWPVLASGGDGPTAIFVSSMGRNPTAPTAFLEGKPGVVQRGLPTRLYVAAWRALMGQPFSKAQAATLLAKPCCGEVNFGERYLHRWRADTGVLVDAVRWITIADRRIAIAVCGDDAFATAAATLQDRSASYGATNEWVRQWISGQDIVFHNCGSGKVEPPSLSDQAPVWLVKDRAYQVAAAHFYQSDFAQAVDDFRAIAADDASPWHTIAPYLVARSLYRAAIEEYRTGDFIALNDFAPARHQAELILFDPGLAQYHDAARSLLKRIAERSGEADRAKQLDQRLTTTSDTADLVEDIAEYRASRTFESFALGRWILAMNQRHNRWSRYSDSFPIQSQKDLAAWRETRSLPWLVAAISGDFTERADIDELIAASRSFDRASPAYTHLTFHRIRLLIDSGRADQASRELDGLDFKAMDLQTRNQFLSLRLASARSLTEFAQVAPRRVAYISGPFYEPDGFKVLPFKRGQPRETVLSFDVWPELYQPDLTYFDDDAVALFNYCLPLATTLDLLHERKFPTHLRNQLAIFVFTRAVAFERFDLALAVASDMIQAVPELQSLLTALRASTDQERQKFLAALIALRLPGGSITLLSGLGYQGRPVEIVGGVDRWWGKYDSVEYDEQTRDGRRPRSDCKMPFVAQFKAAALKERQQLFALAPATTALGRMVLNYAAQHRNDPFLPEALHYLVVMTRYGSHDKDVSRQAFELLHRRKSGERAVMRNWARRIVRRDKYRFLDAV